MRHYKAAKMPDNTSCTCNLLIRLQHLLPNQSTSAAAMQCATPFIRSTERKALLPHLFSQRTPRAPSPNHSATHPNVESTRAAAAGST